MSYIRRKIRETKERKARLRNACPAEKVIAALEDAGFAIMEFRQVWPSEVFPNVGRDLESGDYRVIYSLQIIAREALP
jgi:hypothetical protein